MNALSFSNGRDVEILSDPTMGVEHLDLAGTTHLTLLLMTRKFKCMLKAIQKLPNTYILDVFVGSRRYTPREVFKTPTLFGPPGVAYLTALADGIEYTMFYSIRLNGRHLYRPFEDMAEYIRGKVVESHLERRYFKMAQYLTKLATLKGYTETKTKLEALYNGDVGSINLAYNTIRSVESLLDSYQDIPYAQIERLIDTYNTQSGILTSCFKPGHEAFTLQAEITALRRTKYLRESMKVRIHLLKGMVGDLTSYYTKRFLIQNHLFPKV